MLDELFALTIFSCFAFFGYMAVLAIIDEVKK